MRDLTSRAALKSEQLKAILRESLINGDLSPGDRVPSEPELITRYHVSRGTIREAVVSLVHEGLLYRIQGKGTFVAKLPTYHPTIAVVMPYLFYGDSVHYPAGTDVIPRLMQAIEAEARRVGSNILLYLDNSEPQVERENIANLLERKVDGIILNYIGGDKNADCLQRIRELQIPLVLIDRYRDDADLDYVVTDNISGSYRATRILIEQGIRKVI